MYLQIHDCYGYRDEKAAAAEKAGDGVRALPAVGGVYSLTQAELAEIMGTSQSTVSNWQVGVFEASWKANARMSSELEFDARLRDLLALVFTYGQGTPAPVEEPTDFP